MDLTKATLPEAVEVEGKVFSIHTGHSYWFRFAQIIGGERPLLADFDFLYDGDVPENRQAGVDALVEFYAPKREVPRSNGDDGGERVLDYDIDAELIYAGIMQCYGIDLYDKQMHWHKVRAMLAGLNGTRINDVIGYRAATPGKSRELAKLKAMWALPEKIDTAEQARRDAFAEQFSKAQF